MSASNNQQQNEATNNGIQFNFYDTKEQKSDGRRTGKKKRESTDVTEGIEVVTPVDPKKIKIEEEKKGKWTDDRDLAIVVGYQEHRPYGHPHGKVTEQWEKIVNYVNLQDTQVTSVKKQAVINRFHRLLDIYRPYFSETNQNMNSGSNRQNLKIEVEAQHAQNAVSKSLVTLARLLIK